MYPWVKIKRGREKSIERFHPWVFSGSIESAERNLEEGEVVRLVDINGEFLAIGHCQSGSLAIKILSFQEATINQDWFDSKILKAQRIRAALGLPNAQTNAYRLVHAEGDGLAGLIVDVYGEIAVVQPHSEGMKNALPEIGVSLNKIGIKNILHKPIGKDRAEVLSGVIPERIEVVENGTKYLVDSLNGQKTGFFLDQRDSRELLESFANGKSVLNVFSYTGGFSMAALKGGATRVVSVDSAQGALDVANENANLNGFGANHQCFKTDAVPFLQNMDEVYDIIVLDPPAFAKHKSARHNALQAYRRINEAAIKSLNTGGILFTFSCSQVVTQQLFTDTISSASINAKREVSILHRLRQPADHPVSIFHPEGEYLKGLVLRVD